ncbi:PaaI family thioesterase [Nocardia sp. NPDC057668]|uniref:PaaI family thioesterase n=1 Tax=Nocardia sp. NPDC057668 TaxID=3346202 RepID=UPI0036727F7D
MAKSGFGAEPLAETVAAASVLRRLTGLLLAQERPHAGMDAMLATLAEWERDLRATAPGDDRPRIGDEADDTRRIYLGHAFDIGAYNPVFPEYEFDRIEDGTACGRVTFPLAYEGPPGLVHGGFIAVFVDCATQHQNCAVGLSGKTRSMTVTYRHPTPLLTELRFEIERSVGERGVDSTLRLHRGDELLCVGEVSAVGLRPAELSGASFGTRRLAP